MINNYLDLKIINFKTIFGEAFIKLSNDIKKISPPRIKDNNGAELREEGCPIIEFKVQDINFFEKIDLPQKNFIFIVDKNNAGCSSDPSKQIIYIQEPIPENKKLCFIHTIFHEIRHATLHPYDNKDNLKKEIEAWVYSIEKANEIFGKIEKKYIEILVSHISSCIKSYCNN